MEQKPQIQENPKIELIRNLRHLKNDYKNGIPNEIKHSTSEDSDWKVRKGWFHGVVSLFDELLYQVGIKNISISEDFFKELFEWTEKLTSEDNPFKNRLTKQSDIDETERMINKVIIELEK